MDDDLDFALALARDRAESPINRTNAAYAVTVYAEGLLYDVVRELRAREEITWQEIGQALGVSRQAVQQRFGTIVADEKWRKSLKPLNRLERKYAAARAQLEEDAEEDAKMMAMYGDGEPEGATAGEGAQPSETISDSDDTEGGKT